MAKGGTEDSGKGRGKDDPADHDLGDDHGVDDPLTHDVGDDHGVHDPLTHDVGDDHGVDDPLTHDVGDDHGVHDPLTHDVGDDHGVDDPLTHDVGDDHGVHDPLTHDVGDDHGGDRLKLVLNPTTGQMIFTDDDAEHARWLDDHGHALGEVHLHRPQATEQTVAVWRFHDPQSDVFFWTSDAGLKDSLLQSNPELAFDGEVFRAFADDRSGGSVAIGVVWDQTSGPYGNFIYAPVDDAVQLAGQSDADALNYLGVAFWI